MTQYGANISGNTLPLLSTAPTNEQFADWKAAVDDLANRGCKWVRTGFAEGELLDYAGCSASGIAWQPSRLSQLDAMLGYVHQRGLKMVLLIGTPIFFTTTTQTASTLAGVSSFTVASALFLVPGQQVTFGKTSSDLETLTINTIVGNTITTTAPTAHAHSAGDPVAYSQADFLNTTTRYFDFLAVRYGQWVDAWQCWNEANLGDYRGRGANFNIANFPVGGTGTVPTLNATYLSDLQVSLSYARAAIRNHSTAMVTTNAGEIVASYDSYAQSQFIVFFNALYPYMDVIALDMYDGMPTVPGTLPTIVGYLNALKSTYGKPLIITEFGEYGILGDPTFTEALQASVIPQQMAGLAAANPIAIILYRYRDYNSPILFVSIGAAGDYTTTPTGVTFTSSSTFTVATGTVQTTGASPHIQVTGVTLTNVGMYGETPTIAFTGGVVNGSPATATAVMANVNQHLGIIRADPAVTHKAAYATFFAAVRPDPPTITSISPPSAPIVGGSVATITGTNFIQGATTVLFGSTPALSVNVLSDTQLTCLIPESFAPGAVSLTVTTPGGSVSNVTIFFYQFAVGQVSAVTYATNHLIRQEDVGTQELVAHIYNPVPIGTPDSARTLAAVVAVDGGTVTMTQTNRFDGHTINLRENDRKVAAALVTRATIDLEEPGLGIIARSIVTNPKQSVTINGDGTITVELVNRTDEMARTNLGLRYVDSQEINQIVRNLGNAMTVGESVLLGRDATGKAYTQFQQGSPIGWSADFLDDGTYETTVAPVQWGPNLADNLGGTLLDLTPNGNSVRRDVVTPSNVYLVPCATGTPGHDDPTKAYEFSYQVVVPTAGWCGINRFRAVGHGVAFGFYHVVSSQYPYQAQVIDNSVLIGGLLLSANTRFKVVLDAASGGSRCLYYVQQPTDANWQLVYAGTVAPAMPLYPVAQIANVGGEFANGIVTHSVPMSRIWWQAKFDGLSNLGGLIQLAQDTGLFVREAIDATTAAPINAMEFGPLGEVTGITLVDAGMADLTRLKRNSRKRIIKAVTEYSSVDNVVTVLTALGGGSYPAQLDLEKPFLILHDPTYQNYGAQNFPEYDPNYTVHRVAALGGGFEYYIRYEPAFQPGGIGEIRGEPYTNSALAYPPDGATVAEQELVSRTLYAAAVVQMKAGMRPRVTFSFTAVGYGRPPRAGAKVACDFTHTSADRKGSWIPLHIGASPADDGLWRVLKGERSYPQGGGEPEDTYTLSSSGKYGDSIEAATGQQRQQLAIEVVGKTTSNVSMGLIERGILDADNPIILPFHIEESCYRVTKARFHVEFVEYVQPVKTAQNQEQDFNIAVGAIDIPLPLPADLPTPGAYDDTKGGFVTTSDPIGGFPQIRVPVLNQTFPIDIPTSIQPNVTVRPDRYAWVGGDGIGGMSLLSNGHTGSINAQAITDLSATKGTHTLPLAKLIAKAKDIIAHIPAQTLLAILPKHFHPILPELHVLTKPTQITVQIDSGDGALVERSAYVGNGTATGPWTGDFVFEASRFMNAPGRDVRVQFSSTDNADHGRGALRISWTLVGEYGGLGSITNALL